MAGKASPGLVRFNMTITGPEAKAAFRPYVEKYCAPGQVNNLQAGTRVRIDVPSVDAALELWPLIFTYDTPAHLWKLREVLVARRGSVPKLEITDETDIKWLEFGSLERVLYRCGYHTVGNLTAITEAQLRDNEDVGTQAVNKVKERLAAYGFTLFEK